MTASVEKENIFTSQYIWFIFLEINYVKTIRITKILSKMFCSKRLLIKSVIKSINRLKSQGIVLGSSANEVVAKWKQKFANENISEIDSSIKHILDHVIGRNEVELINFT